MAKPVLVLVDDEDTGRHALARELESRYGAHYWIVSSPSPESALARLTGFRDEGVAVPLVLADHWMPGMTGTEFLARVKDIVPTARRGLLITWDDLATSRPILAALALGQMEFYVPRPAWSPDEQFHRAITESLEEWWRERDGRFEAVTVIGDEPSVRTHEICDILARNSVPFGFYRSDSAEGRQALARLGVDRPAGPVVALFNRIVLVDPGNAEVAEALGVDVRPARSAYDLIIVGAGPAGLAAAVYAASEGLATVLLELEAFGGQAGTSSRIRNYLGFPRGISGADLAWRAYEQAWTFGTHFIYGNPATSLATGEDLHVVGLKDGSQVRSRAVIIATGVSYRRLGIAELESLAGAGVFYGASTIEAQAVAGKPVFVVGGGNSAGQAALHLAKYAEQVTLLVRSQSLAASMSDYLTREIENTANVHVRYRSEVAGGGGDGRLEHLLIRDRDSGRTESVPTAGLFILTGPDAAPHWPLARALFPFETTAPGVFAVGDVRHGSVKRVASAVGEGSIAVRIVHDYLALALQAT